LDYYKLVVELSALYKDRKSRVTGVTGHSPNLVLYNAAQPKRKSS
jgi:hypothetical protein